MPLRWRRHADRLPAYAGRPRGAAGRLEGRSRIRHLHVDAGARLRGFVWFRVRAIDRRPRAESLRDPDRAESTIV